VRPTAAESSLVEGVEAAFSNFGGGEAEVSAHMESAASIAPARAEDGFSRCRIYKADEITVLYIRAGTARLPGLLLASTPEQFSMLQPHGDPVIKKLAEILKASASTALGVVIVVGLLVWEILFKPVVLWLIHWAWTR
jgi:hypothetical protein